MVTKVPYLKPNTAVFYNSTMPYFPYQNRNRVENIKKKFENSTVSDEEKDNNANHANNANAVTLPSNTKLLQELKALNIGEKYSNKDEDISKSDPNLEKTEGNKYEGKALIRRSPAFRREKTIGTKNLTNSSKPKPKILNKFGTTKDFAIKFEEKKNELGLESGNDNNFTNNFKRSNTDINIIRQCNDGISTVKSTLISKQSNLLDQNRDKYNKNEINDIILAQYSVVNKARKHDDEKIKERNELRMTDSIRLALSSPLPKGPPPKKPPRTFLHTQQNCDKADETLKQKEVDEGPKLKLKLEKLEKIARAHDIRSHTNVPMQSIKFELEKKLNKMLETENRQLLSVQMEKENNQSCLQSLNCASVKGCTNVHTYEKLAEKQSEFFVQIDDAKLKSSSCNANSKRKPVFIDDNLKNNDHSGKKSSPEPIYDLPYHNKGKTFETFGKKEKEEKMKVRNIKSDSQLHYMCTDLVTAPQKPTRSGSDILKLTNNSDRSHEGIIKHNEILNRNGNREMLDKSEKNSGRPENLKVIKEIVNKDDLKIIMNQAFGSPIRKQSNASSTNSDSDSPSTTPTTPDETNVPNVPLVDTCAQIIGRSKSDEKIDANSTKSSKDEILSQLTAKRKIYVKRVSSKLFTTGSHFKQTCNKNGYTHLFEYCMLVGLTLGETKKYVPYIKSIFPTNVKPPPLIESLCFPDASDWPPSSENQHPDEQYYSLVITNENGERKFGYCRRVLPEGGHFCLPLTYCIISLHRANGFYYKVLQELESRHGSTGVEEFIKQLYECEFPGPGQSLKLTKILEEAARTSPHKPEESMPSTLVRRPCDIRLEEKDLTQLLEHLEVRVFLKVFSSLLLERKVLLLSNSLRKLSSCIEALQSILVPFTWQHTYIPVLPSDQIEMCDAPTPYVIGLPKPKNGLDIMKNIHFEEGIIVDLEESRIIKCCGDEGSILPPRFTKALKTALNLATSATQQSDSNRNVLISEAFIRFFVEVCGNYSKFIVLQPDGKKMFDKEQFVKSVTSPTTQSFLEWFAETAMFNSFIQDRLECDVQDLFKRRSMEHSEEMDKNTALLLKNYKVINKKVRTLGDRIKDLTSFAK